MMLFLALSMVAGIKTGNASRYGYVGDSYDRVGSFACRRILHARFGERGWQKMRANGVAHRTLPCGTELGVCNPRTGSCTTAYVVDRGPWGALNQKGEWQMRTGRLLPGEHYRGELDLLPGVYTAIGLVGIENVAYWISLDADPVSRRLREKLPPLRHGGPSPFAYSFPYGEPTPAAAMPPLREADLAPLALNMPHPQSRSSVQEYPPLRSQERAFPPLRLAGPRPRGY